MNDGMEECFGFSAPTIFILNDCIGHEFTFANAQQRVHECEFN